MLKNYLIGVAVILFIAWTFFVIILPPTIETATAEYHFPILTLVSLASYFLALFTIKELLFRNKLSRPKLGVAILVFPILYWVLLSFGGFAHSDFVCYQHNFQRGDGCKFSFAYMLYPLIVGLPIGTLLAAFIFSRWNTPKLISTEIQAIPRRRYFVATTLAVTFVIVSLFIFVWYNLKRDDAKIAFDRITVENTLTKSVFGEKKAFAVKDSVSRGGSLTSDSLVVDDIDGDGKKEILHIVQSYGYTPNQTLNVFSLHASDRRCSLVQELPENASIRDHIVCEKLYQLISTPTQVTVSSYAPHYTPEGYPTTAVKKFAPAYVRGKFSGDLFGDEKLEHIAIVANGYEEFNVPQKVVVLDTDGAVIGIWESSTRIISVKIADVDDDGKDEVIILREAGQTDKTITVLGFK